MEELFKSFGQFIKEAQYGSFAFWAFPIATFLLIWLLTVVGLKIFTKRKKLKTVFIIHKAWICSSIIVATIIIGLICFWWAKNFFSEHHYQLSLLISLFVALLIPIIAFISLRSFFTSERLKEIAHQPKTPNQFEETISHTKKEFRKKKLCFFILLIGFLFLLFALNKGQNLISIVFDNSGSMANKNAVDALSETFDNLESNNEIILTTLEGLDTNTVVYRTIDEILNVKNYSRLKAGNVVSFTDPSAAKAGINQMNNLVFGSPICESIWKTFLYIKETKTNNDYKKKLLIIITDGDDNLVGNSIPNVKFFFDKEEFTDYFPPDKVFIIDYSNGTTNPLLQKFLQSNCESYNVTNDKQDYINALDTALNSFKNNWCLIYWTIIITVILTVIAIFIEPKKIV